MKEGNVWPKKEKERREWNGSSGEEIRDAQNQNLRMNYGKRKPTLDIKIKLYVNFDNCM